MLDNQGDKMSAQPNSTPEPEVAVITAQTFPQPTAPWTLRALANIRDMPVTVPSSAMPLRQRITRAAAYVSI